MNTVVSFFSSFIAAESKAALKRRSRDVDSYNAALEKMDAFLAPALQTDFGMVYLSKPDEESYYEQVKNMKPVQPRHLFRVDKLAGPKGQSYMAAYVSGMRETKQYFQCLVARPSKTNKEFEIFSRFTYGYNDASPDKKHWFHSGGEELNPDVLNNIEETVRLVPPEDDPESMKLYLRE